MSEEKKAIVTACIELTAVAAGIARVLAKLAQSEVPRKGPGRAVAIDRNVIQMPRMAAGE